MCDNKHTLAPLRQTEVLSVKASEGATIAEFPKPGEEAVKIVGLVSFLKLSKASNCVSVKSGFDCQSSSSLASVPGCFGRTTVRRI